MTRKISAHYIYINEGELLKFGVIQLDNEGTILEIVDTKGILEESENLEFYNGLIVPGFIVLNRDMFPDDCKCIRNNEQISIGLNPLESSQQIRSIVLIDFDYIDDNRVSQLLSLEKSGMNIVFHFSDIKNNPQQEIFQHIHLLSQNNYLSFYKLLQWTAINPSRIFNANAYSNGITVNSKPGINVISGLDYHTSKLSKNCLLTVIL
jgi:hypothetical protein